MNKSVLVLSIAAAVPASAVRAAPADPVSVYSPAPPYASQLGTFNTPYYALLKEATGAGISFAMARDSRLRFGTVAESGVGRELYGPNFNEHHKRYLSSAEFEQKVGRAVGIVSIGVLRESGLMLGSVQGNALALNARPTTTFTSISAGYALGASTSLMATASTARTAGFGSPDSLISQVSAVRTTAYSVGLVSRHIWSEEDRFGLTFSVPARVRSGEIQLSSSLAQPGASALSYSSQTLNFHPTAIERDVEMTYSTKLGRDGRQGKVTGAIMWRVNPNHDANAKPDLLLGVRYGVSF